MKINDNMFLILLILMCLTMCGKDSILDRAVDNFKCNKQIKESK